MYEVQWEGIMHRCTHMDAPLHVTENTPTINDYPLWRLFGTGVAIHSHREVGSDHPRGSGERHSQDQEGDIVMINTGFHHKWADTDEYFAYGPGIGEEGAKWLVDKKVKMVGYGCQANDHPMATKLVDHGLGPTQPHLIEEYKLSPAATPRWTSRNGSRRTRHSWSWVASRASRMRAATWTRSPANAAPSCASLALAGWRRLHRTASGDCGPGRNLPL